MRPWTRCRAFRMSTSQRKNTLISVEPGALTERTLVIPGTSRIASSMGRVTVRAWTSTGAIPLSTRITIRGKSVCGKMATGSWKVKMTPATQKLRTTRRSARPWASTNGPRPMASALRGPRGAEPVEQASQGGLVLHASRSLEHLDRDPPVREEGREPPFFGDRHLHPDGFPAKGRHLVGRPPLVEPRQELRELGECLPGGRLPLPRLRPPPQFLPQLLETQALRAQDPGGHPLLLVEQ